MENDSIDKPAADDLDIFPGVRLLLRCLRSGTQRAEEAIESRSVKSMGEF
jgi:hypothetical protein